MKKKILLLFTWAAFSSLLLAAAVVSAWNADDITGNWYTEGNLSIIRIYKNVNGHYFGKILWIQDSIYSNGRDKVDKNNPDPKKRNESLVELVMLRSFKFKSNKWTDGTIYDPETGKSYSCTITMPDKNTLNVRGYIGIPAFGRSTTWKRKTD